MLFLLQGFPCKGFSQTIAYSTENLWPQGLEEDWRRLQITQNISCWQCGQSRWQKGCQGINQSQVTGLVSRTTFPFFSVKKPWIPWSRHWACLGGSLNGRRCPALQSNKTTVLLPWLLSRTPWVAKSIQRKTVLVIVDLNYRAIEERLNGASSKARLWGTSTPENWQSSNSKLRATNGKTSASALYLLKSGLTFLTRSVGCFKLRL